MDTLDNFYSTSTDNRLDAQRDIIRESLNEIAADIGMVMRDEGLHFPVYITVRNSGDSLATIATPLDPSDDDWSRAAAIVCEIIEKKVGSDKLTSRASQSQLATNDLQIGNEVDAMRAKIAELDQQVATTTTRHSIEVRAPGAGSVTAIAIHPGQTVTSGARMLTIVPSAAMMQAELLAPSSAIAFLRPGEQTALRGCKRSTDECG